MKKYLLAVITIVMMQCLHAQTIQWYKAPYPQQVPQIKILPLPVPYDTSLQHLKLKPSFWKIPYADTLIPNTKNIDGMPVAGFSSVYTYYGNNGMGFNVFQAGPDNMYVLKPDSSFISKMPVVNLTPLPAPQKPK